MKTTWRTLWQQHDIVVFRDEIEVDRLAAAAIVRVYLVHRGSGDSPGDVLRSVVELEGGEGYALFESNTGFASRVNFERQAFWRDRHCVHWVAAADASLPWRLRFSAWRGNAASRAFRRVAREELAGHVASWRSSGPQTWEERKNHRIGRSRPFGFAHGASG